MLVNTPISIGELIDKISILKIKLINITDKKKLVLIEEELKLLENNLQKLIQDTKVSEYLEMLIQVNSKLWEIENNIRDCEKLKKFDQNFIDLARKVYLTNDKRSEIKSEINKYFGSQLVEVKSYSKY